jgi:signal transduction histidine kinase
LKQLDGSLETLIPLASLVAAVAGAFLVGSTMRPMSKLTEAARSLDADLSKERLPIEGNDEFADLARAFNGAFDRTSNAFAAQTRAMKQLERFTGDAGHELRTPLGAIKGSVTFLLGRQKRDTETRKSLEIIDRACDRMTRLINDLLLLARNDGGQQILPMGSHFLSAVVNEAVEVLAMPAGIMLQICIEPGQIVVGNANALSRLFSNLLTNAFAYAKSIVRISAEPTGSNLVIGVEDDGEGIAHEHLSRLGERFYRPESARSRSAGGTGLGLAIVKSIAEAHGGATKVQVIIPVA